MKLILITIGLLLSAMTLASEVKMTASVKENPCNQCLKYCK